MGLRDRFWNDYYEYYKVLEVKKNVKRVYVEWE